MNTDQLKGIKLLRTYLIDSVNYSEDEIQNKLFDIAKEKLGISPKMIFEAIYLIILGKKYGPRLGPFLSMMDKEWLLNRLVLKDI